MDKNDDRNRNDNPEEINAQDALQSNLLEALRRLEKRLILYRGAAYRQFGPRGNPARGQGRVLALLKMKEEIPQRELCYLLDMRQQSLSELLGKLEQKGYILRKSSETDRRAVTVSLTDKGKEVAESLPDTDKDDIFSVLTEEEQQQLVGYLNRIGNEIDKKLKEMGIDPCGYGWGPADWNGRGHHHPHRRGGSHGGNPGGGPGDFGGPEGRGGFTKPRPPKGPGDFGEEERSPSEERDNDGQSAGRFGRGPVEEDVRYYRGNMSFAGMGWMLMAADEDGLVFFDD